MKCLLRILLTLQLAAIMCPGKDPSPSVPQADEAADADAASHKAASAYIDSLKKKDKASMAVLFVSQKTLGKSRFWSFLPPDTISQSYADMRKSFLDDMEMLHAPVSDFIWSMVKIMSVREIGRHDNEIDALDIHLTFGIDGELQQRVVTGPLIMDHQEWKFVGRCPAPLLSLSGEK